MTANEPNNGDIDVPENFSAEEPQQSAEPLESPESSAAAETTRKTSTSTWAATRRAARTTSISTSTSAAPPGPEAEDDFELDFGSLATTEEPAAAEAEPEEESDAGQNALEAFRSELRAKPGDWYVVHTYSGMENRVLQNLENRVSSLNMEDFIYEIVVPTEEVTEIRNGQRKQVRRTVLPGYVLVRMDLTDESWSTVRHTPSVTGFVGHSNSPVALSLDEVEKMLAPAVIAAATATSEGRPVARRRSRSRTSPLATQSWSSMGRSQVYTQRSPRSM